MRKLSSFVFKKIFFWLEPKEIENSQGLQIISWCILVSLSLFLYWSNITIGARVFHTNCWPFFQNCQNLQNIFFLNSHLELRGLCVSIMLGLLCFSAFYLLNKKYNYFLLLLTIFYILFLLPWFLVAGYHELLFTYPEYYLFFIVSLFLFTPRRRFLFLTLFFILSYFL